MPQHVIRTRGRLNAIFAAPSSRAVGIDVAEPRKGLDLVALDRDRNLLIHRSRLSVSDAVSLTLALEPTIVCIDSPSAWSISGPSRLAERELARIRIQSYRTGPDPGDHPFYRWMRVGFELFERLAPAYPLYRGGDPTHRAAEVFPHATACLLAGRLRERATPKHVFRKQTLASAGVHSPELTTPDQIDAALAALTGLIALDGGHCVVGDPDEGVILVPVNTLPDMPLSRNGERNPLDDSSPHRGAVDDSRGTEMADASSALGAPQLAGRWVNNKGTAKKLVASVAGGSPPPRKW